eukprot:9498537-Pyramimonas_sp.AAC.1
MFASCCCPCASSSGCAPAGWTLRARTPYKVGGGFTSSSGLRVGGVDAKGTHPVQGSRGERWWSGR